MSAPETLALEAMAHGGFTTPATEAYRFLFDASRELRMNGSLSQGTAATAEQCLAWIDRNPRSATDALRELERLSEVFGLDWRRPLMAAIGRAS